VKRVAGEDAHTQARVLFAVQGAWFAATEGKEKGASSGVCRSHRPDCLLPVIRFGQFC
jgi:hypothetical protein